MDLFLAQNHAPMTHLPIATSILAALAAVAALFINKRELQLAWAVLSIVAIVSVVPTLVTGVEAGRGRNFIEHGIFVSEKPDDAKIALHQRLGISGACIALVFAALGIAYLRGKHPNKYLVAVLAVSLAIVWNLGGHIGGEESWGPDTFPAFEKPLPPGESPH